MDKLKPLLAIAAIVAVIVGWSYLNEGQYRAFASRVRAQQAQAPFTRIISTLKTIDIGSPWSWFNPRTYGMAIAAPDSQHPQFFRVLSYRADEAEPATYLVAPECEHHRIHWYAEGDESGARELARNVFGEPILAASGQPFILVERVEPPSEWHEGICNHDWTAERQALARAMRQRAP